MGNCQRRSIYLLLGLLLGLLFFVTSYADDRLFNVADSLVRVGEIDQALSLLSTKAAEIEAQSGPNDTTLIELYRRQGLILLNASRAEEAEPFVVKALEMTKRLDPANSFRLVGLTMDNAVVLHAQGRLDEAATVDSAALLLHSTLSLPIDSLAYYARTNLVMVYLDGGDSLSALPFAIEAVGLLDSIPTSADSMIARITNTVASFLYAVNELSLAGKAHLHAERFFTAALGESSAWSILELYAAANAYRWAEEFLTAEMLYKRALARSRPLTANDSSFYAAVASGLGELYVAIEKYDSSATYYQQSLEWYRAVHDTSSSALAGVLENLASAYYSGDRDLEAIPLLEEAIAYRERYFPGQELSQNGFDYNRIANVIYEQQSPELAIPVYQTAIDYYERAGDTLGGTYLTILSNLVSSQISTDPPGAESTYVKLIPLLEKYSVDTTTIASAYNSHGLLLFNQGRYAEAEPSFRQAVLYFESVRPLSPENLVYWNNLANVIGKQGRLDESDSLFAVSYARIEATIPIDTATLASMLIAQGTARSDHGQSATAVEFFTRAFQLNTALGERGSAGATEAAWRLVFEVIAQGDFDRARSLADSAYGVITVIAPHDTASQIDLLETQASAYVRQKEFESASQRYQVAISLLEKRTPADSARISEDIGLSGWSQLLAGNYTESSELLHNAYDRYREMQQSHGADSATSRNLAEICTNLGKLHGELAEYDSANVYYRMALAIADSTLSPDNPEVVGWQIKYIDFLNSQDRYAECEQLLDRVTATALKYYGPEDTTTLAVLTRRASFDILTGNVSAGKETIRKVAEIRRRTSTLSENDLADVMILLALGHRGAGNYVEAEQLLKRVIVMREGSDYFDATTLSQAQSILANLYTSQWKMTAAESLYTALLLQERALWPELPRVANHQLSLLAAVYTAQGRFDLALHSIDTLDLMYQEDSSALASWKPLYIFAKANVEFQRGDFSASAKLYQELLAILDSTLEEHKRTIYNAKVALARSHLQLRMYDSAEVILPPVDSYLVRSDLAKTQESFEHVIVYGHVQRERGLLDQATETYHRVIEVVKEHEIQYAATYAEALIGLGEIRMERQEFREADSLYSAGASFLYRYLGESHPLFSEALLGMARVQTALARFSIATEHVDKAISTIRRIHGEKHPLLATAYDVQGTLFAQQARYADAESSFVQFNSILSAQEGQQSFGDVIYKKRMAELAVARSNSADALIRYADVIGPILAELGPLHPEVVSAFLQGAEVLLDMGLLSYVDTTLGYFDSLRGDELGQRIVTATGVQMVRGRLAMARGDFARAERLLRDALGERISAFGANAPSLGECYAALGNLYAAQDRQDEVINARQRALGIYRSAYGELHPLVAKSTLQLAEWHRDQGDYPKAEPLFREALQTFGHIYGSLHASTAATIHGLADLHMRQGHLDEAQTLYSEEYVLDSALFGLDHPSVAANFTSLGDVSYQMGKLTEADTLYMAARVIYQRVVDSHTVAMVPALLGETRCALRMADWPRAIEASRMAFETAHRAFRRNALALSESDALVYSQQISQAAQMFLTAYMRAETVSEAWDSVAVDIILQVKGQVSEEVFNRHRALRTMQDSTIQALSQELREISLQRSRQVTSSHEDKGAQLQIDSLNLRADEIESELALRSSEFRGLLSGTEISAKSVSDRLPNDVCLIEYFSFADQFDLVDSTRGRYLAIVLRRNSHPRVVDLGSSAVIDEQVASYRRHMTKVSSSGYTLLPLDAIGYAARSRAVWESVWKPVEKLLAGSKTVMVAPDAALNLVSFSALKDSAETYLIEKYPIHYLSSGRDLLRIEAKPIVATGLFAMGDPDYSASPSARVKGEEIAPSMAADSATSGARNIRSSCGTLADMKVAQLPSTRKEIEQIMSGWRSSRKEEIQPFFGPNATEDNIKKFSPGHRVVHIATHGFFLSGVCGDESDQGRAHESPLLQSGLLLAGANLHGDGADSAGIDDGILTAEEVVSLPLTGTQLVVLSACETGLGEVKAGEGVYGLRRAFLLAGAGTVISSLWPVPDKETASMMSQLYAAQDGAFPDLLRQIQLARIGEIRKSGGVDHPFSWGAFIILGKWR